jgi:hypothetical protein
MIAPGQVGGPPTASVSAGTRKHTRRRPAGRTLQGPDSQRGLRGLGASPSPQTSILILIVALLLTVPVRGRATDPDPRLPITSIETFAAPFFERQHPDGGYDLGPRVQRHLKAEIAMALCARATGDARYAQSAFRDLQWVIQNRLEQDGGLNWDGQANPYLFECHQHWFLLASTLIEGEVGFHADIREAQTRVWRYLTDRNPAGADFYAHNQQYCGPFFAYRNVDRNGRFQSQAPFKGSYEVGAALWSLALHRNCTWLDSSGDRGPMDEEPPLPPELTVAEHLQRMVSQISLSSEDDGFVEPSRPLWIRSLLWNGITWQGCELHDWKYALHMEEGALLYGILTGESDLQGVSRSEAENLIALVSRDGAVESMPDAFGSENYEYGEALSVLGLAATAFRHTDSDLSSRSLAAGRRTARFVVDHLHPSSDEDCAVLLTGLARIYQAQFPDSALTSGLDGLPSELPSGSLRIWPNPASESVSLGYLLPTSDGAIVRVIDITGRERASFALEKGRVNSGTLLWEPVDEASRPLPSGRYSIVMEAGKRRASQSLIIVR